MSTSCCFFIQAFFCVHNNYGVIKQSQLYQPATVDKSQLTFFFIPSFLFDNHVNIEIFTINYDNNNLVVGSVQNRSSLRKFHAEHHYILHVVTHQIYWITSLEQLRRFQLIYGCFFFLALRYDLECKSLHILACNHKFHFNLNTRQWRTVNDTNLDKNVQWK